MSLTAWPGGVYSIPMVTKRVKVIRYPTGKRESGDIYRVTIPAAVVREAGTPEWAQITCLSPAENGGPMWIIEPEARA